MRRRAACAASHHKAAELLTIRDDEPHGVTIWWGNGEHEFTQDTRESFKEWLERAALSPEAYKAWEESEDAKFRAEMEVACAAAAAARAAKAEAGDAEANVVKFEPRGDRHEQEPAR